MSNVDVNNEYKYMESIVIYVGFDYYDNNVHCHIRYGLKSICQDKYPKDEFIVKIPAEVFRNYYFGSMYNINDLVLSMFAKAIMNNDIIDDRLIDNENWVKTVAWYIYHDQILKVLLDKFYDNARELIKLKEDE